MTRSREPRFDKDTSRGSEGNNPDSELQRLLAQALERSEQVQAQLDAITRSPAWQLVQRYRSWLEHTRWNYRWLHTKWEAMSRHIFRGLRVESATRNKLQVSSEPYTPASYESWIRDHEPDEVQLDIQRRVSPYLSHRPKISVILPVYRVPVAILRAAIDSVLAQTYENWELCIAVPRADNPEACSLADELAAVDSRIRVKTLAANEGISSNSNYALELATGEFLALLDHDDTLAPHAFFEIVRVLNQDPNVDFFYSDKDQLTEDGTRRLQPLFKPRWSPEILLNANYLTHLCVMRTEHVRELGGWRKETDGAQDWDLFLRLIQRHGRVRHIPGILYHWRKIRTSVAGGGLNAKPYAEQGQVRAVKDHCGAIGIQADVSSSPDLGLRIVWPARSQTISLIYLTSSSPSQAITEAARVQADLGDSSVEVLVPVQGECSSPTGGVRVVPSPAGISLADKIQTAVESATGQTLVFLDSSAAPATPDWLSEITGPLQLDGVGIVGARVLDFSTRLLRHCGVVFTRDGSAEHVFAGGPDNIDGVFGVAGWYRNWSAVSGACFAIHRDVWQSVGGLGGNLLHPRLDLHLCLKVQRAGKRIVYTPFARLLQNGPALLESPVRPVDQADRDRIRAFFSAGDPYFHPDLNCHNGAVTLRTTRVSIERPRGRDFAADALQLTRIYDCTPEQVQSLQALHSVPGTGQMNSVLWILPDFSNAFHGGVHTILRFADGFQRSHGTQNHFCVVGNTSESQIRQQLGQAFPDLARNCQVTICNSDEELHELPASDAAVCSFWTTAYDLLKIEQPRRKFYFIQDDEALFYPSGSISALVEAAYRFGFHGICNTVPLLNSYAARGGKGESFTPQIDHNIFHSRNRKEGSGPPYVLFCYARPDHPRNCFELVAAALRLLKCRLGDDLLVLAAGAEWSPESYGLDGIVYNLGVLEYHATGDLYRMCDAGLVMMMTRHPSYLPMELMGCGALVVTNHNPDTAWLLKDGVNCLLANPTPGSLAQRLEEGLQNYSLRSRIVSQASSDVSRFSHWNLEIEKIYRYMTGIC